MDTLVPVAIRRPASPASADQAFVASLTDIAASPGVYRRLQDAETEYRDAIGRWRALLAGMGGRRPDPVVKWKLANEIKTFERRMRRIWKLRPTNLLEAVSRDIGISDSALGYIMHLHERFSLAEVRTSALNWSKYQEILDIKDDQQMRKCLKLVKEGRIKFDSEIREFKRTANAGRRG